MTDLTPLIERLEKAEDGYVPFSVRNEFAQVFRGMGIEEFPDDAERTDDGLKIGVLTTALHSLDAAIALVERLLPGWSWKVGTCCVSDDAWLCPDWNDPEHGERLRAELGEARFGEWQDVGIDVDLRPPGRPAIALCIALLRALKALQNKESAA